MNYLKQYVSQPKTEVNGKIFIDRDITKEYLFNKLEDLKEDCFNEDEQNGVELSMQVILSALKE